MSKGPAGNSCRASFCASRTGSPVALDKHYSQMYTSTLEGTLMASRRVLTPGQHIRFLRMEDPLIRLEDLAAVFGWNKEVLRAIEHDEIALKPQGGTLTQAGPHNVSYSLIVGTIEQLRNKQPVPLVSRRSTRQGVRVLAHTTAPDGTASAPAGDLATEDPNDDA